VEERANQAPLRAPTDAPTGPPTAPADTTAVVLTHMRPGLAGDVTRSLVEIEGFAPERIVVVVNGTGGLDDPALEEAVRMVRLPVNLGPAGGFRAGMLEAFADEATSWAYLCEDDVGLFEIPGPRVAELHGRVEARTGSRPTGAVVAYGRRFEGRGGHSVNYVPPHRSTLDLDVVDVACWGATLVSREVVDRGVLPDTEWFFGYEDFDFFCRVREAGFDVLVDGRAAASVAHQQTVAGRDDAHRQHRPTDADEPWRAYYVARNFFELARRHGRTEWLGWHLAYSARRMQLARSGAERLATLRGLRDGAMGRMGENSRYGRKAGEHGSTTDQP
jgi:hypothetical protein